MEVTALIIILLCGYTKVRISYSHVCHEVCHSKTTCKPAVGNRWHSVAPEFGLLNYNNNVAFKFPPLMVMTWHASVWSVNDQCPTVVLKLQYVVTSGHQKQYNCGYTIVHGVVSTYRVAISPS